MTLATLTRAGARRGRFGGVGIPGETGPSGVPGRLVIVLASTQAPPSAIQLGSGESVDLDALVYDSGDDSLMTGLTVTWGSSAPGVVTVNGSGVVSYVANGTANVTASVTSGGGQPVTDVELVTATGAAAVATVDVTPLSVSGVAGSSAAVTYTPRDANGNALTGRVVTVSTADGGVATQSIIGYAGTIAFVAAGTTTAKGTCEGVDSSPVSVTVSAVGGSLNPNMPASITSYRERFWNAQNDAGAPGSLATEGGWYDSMAHAWPQVVSLSDSTLLSDLTSGQVAALYKGSANNVGKSQFTGAGDGTSPTLSSFQNGSSSGFNSDEVYASIVFAPSLNWDHITSYKLFQFSTHTPGTGANTRVGVVVHLRANQTSKFGDTTTPLTLDLVISVNTAGGTTEVRAASGTIVRGSANHVEIYIKLNTPGTNDGICRMWFNGVQVMSQSALGFRGGSATILGGDQFYLVNLYSSKGGPTTADVIAAPCRLYYGYTGIGWA